MIGVDATARIVERGRQPPRRGTRRSHHIRPRRRLRDRAARRAADFVWGEDAWCYVDDKPALIGEAARLLRPGGVIAFTDWVEGPTQMDRTKRRLLRFMRFPSILDLDDYRRLLENAGLRVETAEDTGASPPTSSSTET